MEFRWMYLFYIFMAFVAIRLLMMAGSMVIPGIRQGMMESEVKRTGVGINAQVKARERTGMFDAGLPVYKLTFTFKTKEGVEVESGLDKPLAAEEVMRYSPGEIITIKYDPNDPKRIALYDKPLILDD